ncbi:MAG TPA: thiamine phosphate synthase [Pirellulales bacterium]|nr:thiamine phosphate synthase [Pirellulales bacterium]
MAHEFTPAAERALVYAGGWRMADGPNDSGAQELGPVALLLGLLAEPECRAAVLAAARGVDKPGVLARWPAVEAVAPSPTSRVERLSAQLHEVLAIAEEHLAEYPQPHVLATEHLLLGLAAGHNEVAEWLTSRGWDTANLAAEIDRLAGHDRGPLPFEFDTPEVAAAGGSQTSGSASGDQIVSKPGDDPDNADQLSLDPEEIGRLRIVDAASNRAGEAMRVLEDYARFVLDDRHLAGECKALRHALAAALAIFPTAQRHAARETRADVGTTLTVASEQSRADLRAVVTANFKRLEQALRSLEEYAKSASASTAAALEPLRYRTYTLERAIGITADSLDRLAMARLYVLIDGRESAAALADWIDLLVAAGADVIQLRDKRLSDRELLARAHVVRQKTVGTPALFIVNDRPDIARLARADGVHVGQDELGVKEARTIVGPDALVGVSTHSLEQARAAVLDGANYIGVGPVFPSGTKEFAEFPGLELLRAVRGEIRLPAFAIGGIDAGNLAAVRACGFERVAVSGAVTASAQPADAVRELKRLLA